MVLTAQFTPIEEGYMGQIAEWPEVVTEGNSLENCKKMLIDALNEMTSYYKENGLKIPYKAVIFDTMNLETEYVC
jgi:predicted RNase H-like HicB family nuclease